MTRYLLRRGAFLLVTLAGSLVLIFALLRLLPGDPANALLSGTSTPEQIAAARRQVGSDLPLGRQVGEWLGRLVHLDLGTSFTSGLDVRAQLAQRMSVTLPLTLSAFLLALLVAVPLGYLAARYRDRALGVLVSALSQVGIAIPVFWIGMILVLVVAVRLRLLPSGGFPGEGWADPAAAVRSLVLPVVTIGLISGASLTRYVRAATLDVLDGGYIAFARSLGESRAGAMLRHGLRNAAVPVISVAAIELATTFVGAVIVEQVFSLPGLGSMLTVAIAQHDYPSIQGVLLISTALVLGIGFAADVLQRVLDPRLRGSLSGARA